MSNTIIETMQARCSIRKYTDKALTEEELSALSAAALSSPTAMDRQNQKYYFITNTSLISNINDEILHGIEDANETALLERIKSRNGAITYGAPLLVIIANDTTSRYSGVDAGIAVQNLALCAKSIGLDSVILGMPAYAFHGERGEKLKAVIGIDSKFDFAIAIAIGHRDMDKEPHTPNPADVIYVR